MPPLLRLDPAREARELRNARIAEASAAAWRRSWQRVYAQCIALFALGYVLYGVSWGLADPTETTLVVAASALVSYVLPLARLLVFFLRHADQF